MATVPRERRPRKLCGAQKRGKGRHVCGLHAGHRGDCRCMCGTKWPRPVDQKQNRVHRVESRSILHRAKPGRPPPAA